MRRIFYSQKLSTAEESSTFKLRGGEKWLLLMVDWKLLNEKWDRHQVDDEDYFFSSTENFLRSTSTNFLNFPWVDCRVLGQQKVRIFSLVEGKNLWTFLADESSTSKLRIYEREKYLATAKVGKILLEKNWTTERRENWSGVASE